MPGGPHTDPYTAAQRLYGLGLDTTEFKRLHKQGHLPARVANQVTSTIKWKQPGAPLQGVDLERWLPTFVEGARESDPALRLLAVKGVQEMLKCGSDRWLEVHPKQGAAAPHRAQHVPAADGGDDA